MLAHAVKGLSEPLDGSSQMKQMVQQLAESDYVLLDQLWTEQELQGFVQECMIRHERGDFSHAGIGAQDDYTKEKSIRGDRIDWLNEQEPRPLLQPYFRVIHQLIETLNCEAFLGLKDVESHFAHYPPGTHYQRHLDQFRWDSNRSISLVLYLNPSWQASDGGALRLYPEGKEAVDLLPQWGRLVLFRSDVLEHEVLPTFRDRYSITGWLLRMPKDLFFLNL